MIVILQFFGTNAFDTINWGITEDFKPSETDIFLLLMQINIALNLSA
tara:strand:- start:762 stop:902 length:141 start_codon:yes stop_codon:yes gene_type:complete